MSKFKFAFLPLLISGCLGSVDPNIGGIDNRSAYTDRVKYFKSRSNNELCQIAIEVEEKLGSSPITINGDYVRLNHFRQVKDDTSNSYIAMEELSERMQSAATMSCEQKRKPVLAKKMADHKRKQAEFELAQAEYEAKMEAWRQGGLENLDRIPEAPEEPRMTYIKAQEPHACYLASPTMQDVAMVCSGSFGGRNFQDALVNANAEFKRTAKRKPNVSAGNTSSGISCITTTLGDTATTTCY